MPPHVIAAARACILETAAAAPGATLADEFVVDLGCGEGGLLIELARQGARCEGIDILPGAIETANTFATARLQGG